MKEFKIRCSQIGQIMSEPRSKKDKEAGLLSKTAQSYCKDWLKEQIYSRRKEFTSKYTDKGNIMEDNSIDVISDHLGLGMLLKNEQRSENGIMTGTPDIITKELIIDVKNSWDCFTFPLFAEEIPNKDYYYQLQGYMNLTGKWKAKLIYVLSNTPDHLIDREAYYYCKNNGYDEVDNDILTEFYDKMTYDNIDSEYRIKIFDIERDQEVINEINAQVEKCRNYIKTLN